MKKSPSKTKRKKKVIVDNWYGCYPSDWRGKIIQEATAHPAKYSSRLIEHIYDHLIEMKWVSRGDTVIDPFGGIGLGALHALSLGLNWTGMELERRWFELAFESYECPGFSKEFWVRFSYRAGVIQDLRHNRALCPSCESNLIPKDKHSKSGKIVSREIPSADPHIYMGNIPMWNRKFGSLPFWGSAQMFNGDSRLLSEILNPGRTVAISSPPFGQAESKDTGIAKKGYINPQGVLEPVGSRAYSSGNHGDSDGQLANLKNSEEGFRLSLSSPPYADSINSGGNGIDWSKADPERVKSSARIRYQDKRHSGYRYGKERGQLGSMHGDEKLFTAAITSPPFRQTSGGTNASGTFDEGIMKRHSAGNANADAYGGESGQLANMPEGDFDALVASPPYAGTTITEERKFASKDNPDQPLGKDLRDSGGSAIGRTAGQLGKMPVRDPKIIGTRTVAISSPPFERSISGETVDSSARRRLARASGVSNTEKVSPIDSEKAGLRTQEYGITPGNMGNDSGENFWGAARTIVQQVYANLKPGGHAVWVVKDFVRNWEIVPFCDQWRQLCEVVGFQTVHEHHAQLSRHKGTSYKLEGGEHKHIKTSKGFFRRLRESKGTPPIDYEVVFCMIKPEGD